MFEVMSDNLEYFSRTVESEEEGTAKRREVFDQRSRACVSTASWWTVATD
jgi:hypothetical protein